MEWLYLKFDKITCIKSRDGAIEEIEQKAA